MDSETGDGVPGFTVKAYDVTDILMLRDPALDQSQGLQQYTGDTTVLQGTQQYAGDDHGVLQGLTSGLTPIEYNKKQKVRNVILFEGKAKSTATKYNIKSKVDVTPLKVVQSSERDRVLEGIRIIPDLFEGIRIIPGLILQVSLLT